MHRRLLLPILGVIAAACLGCLWDSDTVRDEATLRPGVWEVISGQIPSHSAAYYQARIALITGRALDARTPVERNDLAVALIRLERFDEAKKELELLLSENPDHYETLSNLGILSKKTGDFVHGAEFLRKALAIRPEGHLGIGDWYLRAVEYRIDRDPARTAAHDFLGQERSAEMPMPPKDSPPLAEVDATTRQRLELLTKLLFNDQHFADGFLVLGDQLASLGDSNLAAFAYLRALDLDHPARELVRHRLAWCATRVARWFLAISSHETDGGDWRDAYADAMVVLLHDELKPCAAWVDAFHAAEDAEVAQGRFPEWPATLAVLEKQGTQPHVPGPASTREEARVHALIADGVEPLRAKQWKQAEAKLRAVRADVERIEAGTITQAEHLELLAAAIAPQGGKAHLDEAEQLLVEADRILQQLPQSATERARCNRNLALIADALHQPDRANRSRDVAAALEASTTAAASPLPAP